MNFKPMNSYVLIKKDEVMSVTASGIHIPGQAQNLPFEGVVIAVYDTYVNERGVNISPSVRVGQRVIFNPMAIRDLTIAKEEFSVLPEKEIVGVLWANASTVE